MRKVSFSRDASRFGKTMMPKHERQIAAKIQALRENPTPTDSIILKGSGGEFRRADVGECRIIYRYDDEMLFIERIVKRNDDEVYRWFRKKKL